MKMTQTSRLLKAVGIWLIILLMAIVNAGIRELLLVPVIGAELALPASGVLLTALILLIAWLSLPWLRPETSRASFAIGAVWFVLTLVFELLLGYFVSGKSWSEVLQVFDVTQGNLFALALVMTFAAPWLSAKIRRLF
ncbi:hypothetical protein HMF8227_00201 [Saliniradius amylolyticus]|uniref:Uncharacterized protein n=1 Tax=Saliniradius amylolyticus TaxID=2183582 RepID=A0A2S2DZD0_9ALTE|nr:hypothetical protein [Saliniradius amylolyticus]AWL10709.1 hypothetical protein HMF8227_00201 [Saliniradius amylolyticus]